MLTLITSLWYLCGAVFALYVILCAVCILLFEREVRKRSRALLSARSELDRLFDGCECTEISDIKALSQAFHNALKSKREPTDSFEFYRQKELFEGLVMEYNGAAQAYNGLIGGYPSCVLASVMGKESVACFTCE